jgi:hypothetical protein
MIKKPADVKKYHYDSLYGLKNKKRFYAVQISDYSPAA